MLIQHVIVLLLVMVSGADNSTVSFTQTYRDTPSKPAMQQCQEDASRLVQETRRDPYVLGATPGCFDVQVHLPEEYKP